MIGIYVLLGGIGLFAVIITALDLWADRSRRKAPRREHEVAARSALQNK